MKPFRWSSEKNAVLVETRGITFERIVVAIHNSGLLDIYEHPKREKYPYQRTMVVECDGYAYLVPFVAGHGHYFLKTIIPSRKATRDYLRSDKEGEKS